MLFAIAMIVAASPANDSVFLGAWASTRKVARLDDSLREFTDEIGPCVRSGLPGNPAITLLAFVLDSKGGVPTAVEVVEPGFVKSPSPSELACITNHASAKSWPGAGPDDELVGVAAYFAFGGETSFVADATANQKVRDTALFIQAPLEKKRLEEQHASAQAAAAERDRIEREREHATVAENCPPLEPKEKGIRFLFGIPKTTTVGKLRGHCLGECYDVLDSYRCALPDAKDDPLEIKVPGLDLRDAHAAFTDGTDDAKLYEVMVEQRFDDCEDAVSALATLHGLVRTVYGKGAAIKGGSRFGSKKCADYMREGNAFIRATTSEWRVTGDIFFSSGHYTVYLAVFNTKNYEPIAKKKAQQEMDDTARTLKKL